MPMISSIAVRAMIAASDREDRPELLAHVGLDAGPAAPDLVDDEAFWAVIERIVGDGDDSLQFRYASSIHIDGYGASGLAFKTAVDLRRALERTVRYIALQGDTVQYELRPDGRGGAAFVLLGRPAHRLGVRIANEAALGAILTVCRQVVADGVSPTPTSVSFTHRAPSASAAGREFFGCSISYGAELDALHLDAAFLDTPTRLGDEALSEFLIDQLEGQLSTALAERGIEARVRHVIANGLADGVPPMRVVARRLGMSERTLHRRLGDEHLRYQDLVVEVRQSVATALLTTTDRSLVDIAFLCGFSDQSAFQRAFKRWTGRTPLAVRRG
ncbi:MAG: AraC family transcriptional regulator ligand-binding domain-containing protein [Actinomycetota bacterium]